MVTGIGTSKPAYQFAIKTAMKTTIELPDSLLLRIKTLALHEQRRFKDVIAEVLEIGMMHRSTKPFRLPKPIKLRGGFVPTSEDIERAIADGRR